MNNKIKRVLADVNILLDAFLSRQQFVAEAKRIFAANDKGRITIYVAASSLPNLFYLAAQALRQKMPRAKAAKTALGMVIACINSFEIIWLDDVVMQVALTQPGEDLEDNLQIAAAIVANLDAIVTRDQDFRRAHIKSLTPTQLLKQI